MNRLQSEWLRLYAPAGAGRPDGLDAAPQADPPDASSLVDGQGRVRALVLQLARPADWRALSRVWQGVQLDLGWPAPAIAVSGSDGHQLWFSLQQAVSVTEGYAVLRGLHARYLGDIAPARMDLWPAHDATAPHRVRHARPIPAEPVRAEQWSAFVAPDLAPVFNDTPWLDLPPNLEGQADLLARLLSISPAEWASAQAQLGGAQPDPVAPAASTSAGRSPTVAQTDPHRFLLDVMHNEAIEMGLRIEAAKALLPYVRPN